MDKAEIKRLREEYLSKNIETIDYVLKDLDNKLKYRILKGNTEINITRKDVYNSFHSYANIKEQEYKVEFNSLFDKFGISIDYKDILMRYKEKLEDSGVEVFYNKAKDINIVYTGKYDLSDIVEDAIENKDIYYLTIFV
jgi:hypothetical protein